MKTILPWIVAALALGGAFFFYNSSKTKSAEVVKLQADVQELETLRAEHDELKKNQVPPDELVRLRKNTEELIRLRGDVVRLKNENEQAAKQAQAAQGEIQRVQAQALAMQQQAQTLTTNLQTLNAQREALAQQMAAQQAARQQVNACINNLRQIDGATQQWALENKKTDQDRPTAQELAVYIKGGLPKCPAGGTYAVSNAGTLPTCSIPGHALPLPQ